MQRNRFVAALLAVPLALLLAASAAHAQPQRARGGDGDPGYVVLTIIGRGSVHMSKGFLRPATLNCVRSCIRKMRVFGTDSWRVAVTETPYKGWKFAGWGARYPSQIVCTNKQQRTCAIRLFPNPGPHSLQAFAHVSARFIR